MAAKQTVRCECCGQIKPPAPLKRSCATCGTTVFKPSRRSWGEWLRRRVFCSRTCANAGYRRAARDGKTCRICGVPQKLGHGARGLCGRHYIAWRRYDGRQKLDDYYIKHAFQLPGDASPSLIELARNILKLRRAVKAQNGIKTCSKRGCNSPHLARGLCHSHYREWWRLSHQTKPRKNDEHQRA